MLECPKPPNEWQYHQWDVHPSACRLQLILLVTKTWERKKLRMLNKGVARPCAGWWQGMPPPSVPVLPVDQLTVKLDDVCECQELQKMYATWSHQLTSWMWTGWRCQEYKRKWGVPWPMWPRDYTASPLGVKGKYLLAWGVHSAQGPSAMCHPL